MGLLNPRSGNVTKTSHSFAQVPKAEIQRSTFDRSFTHKTTFNAGLLIPVFRDFALPGDTAAVKMTAFARLATPIFPIMDNMYLDTHFFAVPIRLVWDNFKKFIGEQLNPGDSIAYTIPQMVAPVGGYAELSVHDYLGLPTKVAGISHSCLWHRAMNLIYQSFFKDQNLINAPALHTDDGPDPVADYTLFRRGKRHDYFTACLPFPQKGAAVSVPLGSTAPVITDGNAFLLAENAAGASPTALHTTSTAVDDVVKRSNIGGVAGATLLYKSGAMADLSAATATTINQLRQAFAIQRLLERDARSGTRFPEVIHAHFGVTHPDSRYRPEFLGGGSTPVIISPIPQTSATDATTTPQGNLSAIGTVVAHNHGFTKSFTEWTLLLGFASIRADLTYQQGMDRFWSDKTRYDLFWGAFSHLGEQSVLNKEIFCDGSANDTAVFGYQEKDAHYRYKPSIITGLFRSNAAAPLDQWHLSQKFAALPVLGQTFIEENPPVDRIVAVPSEPHFIFDSFFQCHWARPIPTNGVPGMIDHF